MPAEMRPREPLISPVPSFSATRSVAAAIETSAVRLWPRVSSSSGPRSSPAAGPPVSAAASVATGSSGAGAAASSSYGPVRASIDA